MYLFPSAAAQSAAAAVTVATAAVAAVATAVTKSPANPCAVAAKLVVDNILYKAHHLFYS